MPRLRLVLFSALICAHAILIGLGDALPDAVAPIVAGTVYGPLWLLDSIGLPVFGRAESGGWPGPSALGWIVVAIFWSTLWWSVLAAITRMRR